MATDAVKLRKFTQKIMVPLKEFLKRMSDWFWLIESAVVDYNPHFGCSSRFEIKFRLFWSCDYWYSEMYRKLRTEVDLSLNFWILPYRMGYKGHQPGLTLKIEFVRIFSF